MSSDMSYRDRRRVERAQRRAGTYDPGHELDRWQQANDYEPPDYDDEHLELDNNDGEQGLMDAITEGTISVPHSRDADIRDLAERQREVIDDIKEVRTLVVPGPLDVIHARRLFVRHFTLAFAAGSTRLLTANHKRRYFNILPDTITGSKMGVWFSTDPLAAAGVNPNAFYVSQTSPTIAYWSQDALYAWTDTASDPSSFAILEFMDE